MNRTRMNRRTKLACNRCRRRKRKCDGEKPICGPCLKDNLSDCTYSYHLDKRRPYSKNYVESLKEHIKSLETMLEKSKSIEPFDTTEEKTSALIHTSSVVDDSNDFNKLSANILNTSEGKKRVTLPEFRHFDELNSGTHDVNIGDLIESYGKFKVTGKENCRYYGPRSTISFISDKTRLINTPNSINDNDNIFQLPHLGTFPSHENYLYESYFSFQNSTLVILWKELFYQQLNLPPSERNPNFISESLLNAVLAVGSTFDLRSENNHLPANEYAKRARLILQDEISKPSISTIQTCCILSIFYMFMNEDSLAWYFNGSAVSSAYSLGLNIGDNMINKNSEFFSEEEAELRRITFWAMYILERCLNNILGRPTFLKSGSITSVVPSEWGVPEYELWHNPNGVNNMVADNHPKVYTRCFSLLTYTIELLITTSKALDHLYLSFKPSTPSGLQYIVNKANTELLQFESSLPEYLRLHSLLAFKNRGTISPGIFVFQLKFQYIRILLHRVFFIRDIETPNQIDEIKILPHKRICYESALNIRKITSQYSKSFGLRSLEFSTPDIICTAAIILLYFIKYPILVSDEKTELTTGRNNREGIRQTSIKSFEILHNKLSDISETNLWAKRSLYILKQLVLDWGITEFSADI